MFEFYPIIEIQVLIIHLPLDGHLGCLPLGALVNKAAVNFHFKFLSGCTPVCLQLVLRSRIAGSHNVLSQLLFFCFVFFET